MKARQYTEEQIIAVLKEGEAGAKIGDLCRKYGMSDATYYNWKTSYAGLTRQISEAISGPNLLFEQTSFLDFLEIV